MTTLPGVGAPGQAGAQIAVTASEARVVLRVPDHAAVRRMRQLLRAVLIGGPPTIVVDLPEVAAPRRSDAYVVILLARRTAKVLGRELLVHRAPGDLAEHLRRAGVQDWVPPEPRAQARPAVLTMKLHRAGEAEYVVVSGLTSRPALASFARALCQVRLVAAGTGLIIDATAVPQLTDEVEDALARAATVWSEHGRLLRVVRPTPPGGMPRQRPEYVVGSFGEAVAGTATQLPLTPALRRAAARRQDLFCRVTEGLLLAARHQHAPRLHLPAQRTPSPLGL